jgi:hypothetical protein
MIKTLFFIAALLVPGFAYAGNPSADLSVQVFPSATGSCSPSSPGTDACEAPPSEAKTQKAIDGIKRKELIGGFGVLELNRDRSLQETAG